MFEEGISDRWLRRAAWVTYLFFGFFSLLGLAYVWYAAAGGAVVHAMIGAVVALGSIGLGIGTHCVVQLAGVVAENKRQIEESRQRVGVLEQLLESAGVQVRLPSSESGMPTSLVAANIDSARFPRLLRDATRRSGEVKDDAVTQGPAQDTEGEAPDASPAPLAINTLRTAFRESVYAGDFAGAIEVGEAITAEYPDSGMAAQFRQLRPILVHRAEHAAPNAEARKA